MRIEFDYDVMDNGYLLGIHYIDTESGSFPQVSHPLLGPEPVDVIHAVVARHKGILPMQGSGWDVPSKHPAYQGKTRHEVLVAEIVRLDDKAARALLGV